VRSVAPLAFLAASLRLRRRQETAAPAAATTSKSNAAADPPTNAVMATGSTTESLTSKSTLPRALRAEKTYVRASFALTSPMMRAAS